MPIGPQGLPDRGARARLPPSLSRGSMAPASEAARPCSGPMSGLGRRGTRAVMAWKGPPRAALPIGRVGESRRPNTEYLAIQERRGVLLKP